MTRRVIRVRVSEPTALMCSLEYNLLTVASISPTSELSRSAVPWSSPRADAVVLQPRSAPVQAGLYLDGAEQLRGQEPAWAPHRQHHFLAHPVPCPPGPLRIYSRDPAETAKASPKDAAGSTTADSLGTSTITTQAGVSGN